MIFRKTPSRNQNRNQRNVSNNLKNKIMKMSSGTKWALIIGGLAVIGVGGYFLGKNKGWWGKA